MKNTVSIVIPTYKRGESLRKLLVNLAKTIEKKTEIIVVEQEVDRAREVKAVAKKLGLHLTYIFQKQRSTARAMNTGARTAKGNLLLFLDDDVSIHKNIISHHAKNFDDPRVSATVGRILTDGQTVEPFRADTGRVDWLGSFHDGFSSTIRQEVDTVIGCNTMWRKAVYQKLGGIDERFTGNALRLESDLSLRAKKVGYSLIFDPKAVVTHHRAPTGGARKTEGRIAWYRDFFSNEVYFFLKHRSALLLPLFLLTKSEWAVRCMFGFGREVSLRSIATPITGIIDGFNKYKRYKQEIAAPRQRRGLAMTT